MTHMTVYGIKNCETMKKTFAFLEKKKANYTFHDYKKAGADKTVLAAAFAAFGWEQVINRKGTSWRKLPEAARMNMTAAQAMAAALDNPSLIRRPLVVSGRKMLLGFDAAEMAKLITEIGS